MTIDEMISKLKIEYEEQKDTVAYLETQEEHAYDIEPHRQAIIACEQLAEWLGKYKQVEFEVNWYLDACSEDKGNKQYNMDIAFNSILKTLSNADVNTKKEFAEEIRNKAIDDFAEQLKNSLMNNYKHFLTRDTDGFDWLTTDAVETHINEVAKQLKEGGCRQ